MRLRSDRRDDPHAAEETVERPQIIVETERGRAGLLAHATRNLPQGEALAQVKDVYARRRAFQTSPRSPRAQLVAREPPLVLRGGLTSMVSYWRVPLDELDADETHFEDGEPTHCYEVKLRIACLGRNTHLAPTTPA